MFCQVGNTNRVTFAIVGLALKEEAEGAEQSPSYTPRIASPCVWFHHTSVSGMSSLLASSTQRSKVTQLSEHKLHGLQVSEPQ